MKENAKVESGLKYLCEHECDRSSVPIIINTKAKATNYLGGIDITLKLCGNGRGGLETELRWPKHLPADIHAHPWDKQDLLPSILGAYLYSCNGIETPHVHDTIRDHRGSRHGSRFLLVILQVSMH